MLDENYNAFINPDPHIGPLCLRKEKPLWDATQIYCYKVYNNVSKVSTITFFNLEHRRIVSVSDKELKDFKGSWSEKANWVWDRRQEFIKDLYTYYNFKD